MALGVSSKWDWTLEDAWLDNVLRLRTGYRARFERAMSFINAGVPGRAVSALEELRIDYPDDVPAALGLCAAHEAMGQVDRGLDVLLHADARNADHFAVKLNLGHF
jgi:predicted Zn-dependent protease